MQLWTPPSHRLFMSDTFSIWFNSPITTPITNTLFGSFFLALDRLQQLRGDGTGVGEGVAMADPAVVECVLRHWTLGDSKSLFLYCAQ
jgi:hypothetical protein